jgi:hypothetical protein
MAESAGTRFRAHRPRIAREDRVPHAGAVQQLGLYVTRFLPRYNPTTEYSVAPVDRAVALDGPSVRAQPP